MGQDDSEAIAAELAAVEAEAAGLEALLAQAGAADGDVDMDVTADGELATDTAAEAAALAAEVAAMEAQIAAAQASAAAAEAAAAPPMPAKAKAAVTKAAPGTLPAKVAVTKAAPGTLPAKAALTKAAPGTLPAKAALTKAAPGTLPAKAKTLVAKAEAGSPVKAPKFCGDCGAAFKEVAKFCMECGAKRPAVQDQVEAKAKSPSAPAGPPMTSLLGGYDSDEDGNDSVEGDVVAASVDKPNPSASAGSATSMASGEFMVSAGCPVCVTGLKQAPHLNGQHGVVKQLDPGRSDRWEVELSLSCGCKEIKMMRAQNMVSGSNRNDAKSVGDVELKAGCVVKIDGLQKAAHLNGLHALVVRADCKDPGDIERWEVEVHFPDGRREIKAMKPDNLKLGPSKLLPATAGAATPSSSSAQPKLRAAAVGPVAPTSSSAQPKSLSPAGAVGPAAPAQPFLRAAAVGPTAPASSSAAPQVGSAASKPPDGDVCCPTEFKFGDLVRIHGLKSAHLNGLLASVERFDDALGRWEVKAPDGSVKAIKPQNLAREVEKEIKHDGAGAGSKSEDDAKVEKEEKYEEDEKEDEEDGLHADGDDVDMDEAPSESGEEDDEVDEGDDDEEDEGDGFEAGKTVRIEGLQGAAHLNGQTATLVQFDPSAGRWEVKLASGDIKAIKDVNLTIVGAASKKETVPMDTEDSGEVAGGGGDFSKLDDNEIAAQTLQAEIDGDDALARNLNIELKRRQKGSKVHATEYMEEMFQIPADMVGHVIGTGGSQIARLREESGAKLSFMNSEDADTKDKGKPQVMFMRGTRTAVIKAKKLVEDVITDARQPYDRKGKGKGKGKKSKDDIGGGAAGSDEGVCKWYAAGFCRNRPEPGSTSCRNGKHCSESCKKAEKDWIAEAPPTGSVGPPKKRPVLLLLDLEGGGNADGIDGEDEIIELPTLALCPGTGKELGRFHRFVRPGFWDREEDYMWRKFPAACFNTDSVAEPFAQVIVSLIEFIGKVLGVPAADVRSEDFLFVTCGKWDVKTALPRQSNKPCPGAPGTVSVPTQQLLFSRWCNLKEAFQTHYKLPDSSTPTGMRGMLKRLKISLSGQHHLGMDDVSNLSKILKIIVGQGGQIVPTGTANNLAGGAAAAKKAAAKGGKGQPGKFGKKGDKKGGKGDFGKGDFGKGAKGKFDKGKADFGKGDFGKGKADFAKGKGDKGFQGDKGFKGDKGSFKDKGKGVAPFSKAGGPLPPPPGPPPGPPPDDPQSTGLKRPADELAAEPQKVKKTENRCNPWAEGKYEVEAPVDDLQEFLKNAPRPGEDWEMDDEEEEALGEALKETAGEDAGLLGGVLGCASANDSAAKPKASLASLFASLPKPTASDDLD